MFCPFTENLRIEEAEFSVVVVAVKDVFEFELVFTSAFNSFNSERICFRICESSVVASMLFFLSNELTEVKAPILLSEEISPAVSKFESEE